MQKHERCSLKVAQEEADKHGLTVTLENAPGRVPKARLVLHDGTSKHYHFIPSSPRDRDACIGQARQWARRVAKEITHGRESL